MILIILDCLPLFVPPTGWTLFICFMNFLSSPVLLTIAKIPFCYLSFASSFPGFQRLNYNRAESPGKLISFIKWLRQYHIDIPYNSKFCLYSSNSPLEFAQSNQKLFSDLLLFLNCVRFFSIAGFGAGFHCLMVAFGGRLVLLLLRH